LQHSSSLVSIAMTGKMKANPGSGQMESPCNLQNVPVPTSTALFGRTSQTCQGRCEILFWPRVRSTGVSIWHCVRRLKLMV